MKNYKEPLIELLFVEEKDILTLSDPGSDDIFNMIEL